MRILKFSALLFLREFFESVYLLRRHMFTLPWLDVFFWFSFRYFLRSPHAVARRWLRRNNLDLNTFNHSFVYGETPLRTWDLLIRRVGIKKGDVVFDVGCGSGKSCFFLSRRLQSRAVGIEYNEDFTTRAEWIRKKVKASEVVFVRADARNIDYGDADVVYLFSTTFTLELMQALALRFRQTLVYGAIVISVSVPLQPKSIFQPVDEFPAPYFFGRCIVYVHRFIGEKIATSPTVVEGDFFQLLESKKD